MPAARDPFPSARFGELIRRLPSYARLAWQLSRDDRLPPSRRAALVAGAAYLVSPIDLVPGFIPVAGQLDDAAAILLALRLALNGLPPADREQALADAGLAVGALERDLATVGALYAWLGRQAARLAWMGTRWLARTGSRLTTQAAGRLRRT
ncbi:MAG TPA: YkvA family protein [Candidatus Limnocylindria bacterium]